VTDPPQAPLTRPAVLVLDDFGMRELTAPQADDLYELITERAGKSLILTSNQAPGPSYRPNKSPGRVIPTGNTSGK
jgi:DNA replication protein DnaC